MPSGVHFYRLAPGDFTATRPMVLLQQDCAIADARAHGFTPGPVRVVSGADYGPLEATVLAWFDSLAQRRKQGLGMEEHPCREDRPASPKGRIR